MPPTHPWIWKHRRGEFDLSRHGLIMGILNVTPDSFSDGGAFPSTEAAVRHALSLLEGGASIIDIGGESTRPGSLPVGAAEEIGRVIPTILALRQISDAVISVDTMKATVAEAALEAGADIINDVSGLLHDPAMAGVAAGFSAGVVLMHMQGMPPDMQDNPLYGDVVAEVHEFLLSRLEAATHAGIPADRTVWDPGIGFGKTLTHNCRLLSALEVFSERPVLLGISRKSLLRHLGGGGSFDGRFWPGVALTSLCREMGARIFRVHDPAPHAQALAMTEAILYADTN